MGTILTTQFKGNIWGWFTGFTTCVLYEPSLPMSLQFGKQQNNHSQQLILATSRQQSSLGRPERGPGEHDVKMTESQGVNQLCMAHRLVQPTGQPETALLQGGIDDRPLNSISKKMFRHMFACPFSDHSPSWEMVRLMGSLQKKDSLCVPASGEDAVLYGHNWTNWRYPSMDYLRKLSSVITPYTYWLVVSTPPKHPSQLG